MADLLAVIHRVPLRASIARLHASIWMLALAGLALAAATALGGSSAASAAGADPIVGTWHGAAGTVVISAGYPAFQGKTHSAVTFGSCESPAGEIVWSIEPAGQFGEPHGHYRGEQVVGSHVYYGDSCYFDAVFSVSGNTLTVETTETSDGKELPAGTYEFTRAGSTAPATKRWSWSFSMAALPARAHDVVKRLAGSRAHARGTLVTKGRPQPTDAGFEMYTTKSSSHPAVVFTDLYLHVRNLRTLLHVKHVTLMETHTGELLLGLAAVVRFADLPRCRAGSPASIVLLPSTAAHPAQARVVFCHVDRLYQNGTPDGSDSVSVSIKRS
jgi:hypothetical protein